MLLKNSRYQQARPFVTATPAPGVPVSQFRGLRARPITSLEGVVEHSITDTDRLDHLARHYYDDDRLWWRILDANPQLLDADLLLGEDYVGRVILIPQAKA
jgi:nucleoid-associated protein YgaU